MLRSSRHCDPDVEVVDVVGGAVIPVLPLDSSPRRRHREVDRRRQLPDLNLQRRFQILSCGSWRRRQRRKRRHRAGVEVVAAL